MITETLISDEVWMEAPSEPEEAFLFIVLEARKRLDALRTDPIERGAYDLGQWRKQYIYEISTIAEELGISGLPTAKDATGSDSAMSAFDIRIARIITKIKVSRRSSLKRDTVILPVATKDNLKNDLEKLRDKVNSSNLSEDKKSAIHKKIDAVEAELFNMRFSLRPLWLLYGACGAAASIIGVAANISPALETANKIIKYVHEAKAEEDIASEQYNTKMLGHEPAKLITDQRTT